METAKLIRQARESKKMSQKDLSRKLGLTTSQFVSNIERGVSGLPLKKAKTISEMLNIPEKRLLEAIKTDEFARICKVSRLDPKQIVVTTPIQTIREELQSVRETVEGLIHKIETLN